MDEPTLPDLDALATRRVHDVYPTPTRLRLLADVELHAVHQRADGTSATNAGFTTVTARIAELEQAGWSVLEEPDPGTPLRRWRLTATGRAILDRHRAPGNADA